MGIVENKRVIVHRSRKMNKRRRALQITMRVTIAAIVLAAVAFGIYMLTFFGKTVVDVRDLTTVVLGGYNGKGTADYKIADVEGLEVFMSTVTVSLDKTSELSNGDEIKVTYSYDKNIAKNQKLRVKAGREYVKVTDLPEPNIISYDDLFAAAKITYEGAAPVAKASVENISTDEVLKNIEFVIADEEGTRYDIGDKITIEANIDEKAMADKAVEIEKGPNGYQKTYTVEGIDQYILSETELTPEQLQQMKEHAAMLFNGDANEFGLRIFCAEGIKYNLDGTKYTFEWRNPIYISTYFNHIKPEAVLADTTHVNDIKVVFQVAISQSNGTSADAEAVVIYRNIKKNADGTVDVDLDSAEIVSASVKDSDIKKLVRNEDDDSYDSTRLDI